MSSRERMVAALHQQPVDHPPFDPRVWHRYALMQSGGFREMSDLEMAEYLECDRRVMVPYDQDQYHINMRNPRVDVAQVRTRREHTTIYRTPDGDLVEREECTLESWHPVEYPVKSREDLRRIRWLFAHSEWWVEEKTMAELEAIVAYYGDTALATTGFVTSPLMDLIQRYIGLEKTIWLLHDYPDDMEELMEVMHQDRLRKLRSFLPRTSIDHFFTMENTSVDMTSPAMFQKHCVRYLSDYGKLVESFGKFHVLHMCGKIKQLLQDIEPIPAIAIDSLAPPPVGNTTIRDVFEKCPSKSVLGGTCVLLWQRPEDEIVETILREVAAAGRREGMVLTPGEMPEDVSPEKIRRVWRSARKALAA